MYDKRRSIMKVEEFAKELNPDLLESNDGGDKKIKCMDMRTKTKVIMMYITLLTIIAFIFFALVAYFNPMYGVFGVGILFSRGAALAIVLLTILVLLFVSYDTMTWIRGIVCCRRFHSLFDHLVLYHRFCGYMILLYSVIHSIGHLTGTALHVHLNDTETVNAVFTHNKFDYKMYYHDFVFGTIPGVTGVMLLAIIIIMGITSTNKCR